MDNDFLKLAENRSDLSVINFSKRIPKKQMASDLIKALNTITSKDLKGETVILPWRK